MTFDVGEMSSRKISTPKKGLDARQKAVLTIFVSSGAYHVEKTVRIAREKNIPIAKDTLRDWLRASKCQDYIEYLQKSMGIAIQGVRYNTVQELALLAGSNIMDVIDVNPETKQLSIRNLNELPIEIQRTVKKVRILFDKQANGEAIEIELHDKLGALKELSKISNAAKVFAEVDDMRVGDNFQLAGVTVLPPPQRVLTVIEDELDLGNDPDELDLG